ncbi:MAG: succinate dehydrogenase/fumarate reductase iron-sulfur subunit [Bifidobacteriaceae bacterium]|nr:succinate dehydrogenase/fumarate reductase iron-sulfur subunit [Bifidobacteriaceae bacterium]
MRLILEVWRQDGPDAEGSFETHLIEDATPEMSLLELLDRLNHQLVEDDLDPVAFESDCREGICGTCGLDVNGVPHGPEDNVPACGQHVRSFQDGQTVRFTPFRAKAFPVVRDLIVDRTGLDRIIQAGGTISVDAGTAPDADTLLVTHDDAERALDFAACIGCGACVSACPNGAAYLYTGAKLAHLSLIPHGKEERAKRARTMIAQMQHEFGPCSQIGECALACPAEIPLVAIAAVNRERLRAGFKKGKAN